MSLFLAVTCLATSQTASSAPPSPTPALQTRNPIYRVAPSDDLAVSFPLSPELNQKVTVQPDGFITLANLGSVYVQGQTTPEIVETLKKACAGILHDPIIAVDLTNFQAARFTIFGQVTRPGQYPLRSPTTVSQAVAIGGGLLASAKYQALLLRRMSSDWLEVKKLNVKALIQGKKVSEDVTLQPGDMIYVPETVLTKVKRYMPYGTGIGVSTPGYPATF
ncbi:MAG: polysaccharide biosynthesis/export family protein [Terriglobales bacterium]